MTPLKVLKVINNREVAVSGGADAGLKKGDVLRILDRPIEIPDPDTGEVLGKVVKAKAVVRIYDVQDRFVLARTFRTREVNVGGRAPKSITNPFGELFQPPKWETRTETLRRDPTKGDPISDYESVVQVGDPVEKIEATQAADVPSTSIWE